MTNNTEPAPSGVAQGSGETIIAKCALCAMRAPDKLSGDCDRPECPHRAKPAPMGDELVVTQADIDAARSILWVETLIDDVDQIQQAFARHRLATRPASSQGWQDIATAPRDGTDILVVWPETGTQLVVWWDDAPSSPPWHWGTLDGPYYRADAFSHWQPLPAPPTKDLAGKEPQP